MRLLRAGVLLAVFLSAALVLSGCQAGPAAQGVAGKQAADAAADQQAQPGQQDAFIPVLRKYHDLVQWPVEHDLTAEQMWEKIAPYAGQVVLDDAAARSHVGVLNQCAWSMSAIEVVKAGEDTAEVRHGLEQSTTLMPASESLVAAMTDEIELGSLETPQQYVTANKCADDFGP